MYDYGYTNGYGSSSSLSSTLNTMGIWGIIALVIAIIGGICLYFTVFSAKNEKTYKGFMAKLYDFVKFKKMFITTFLKVVYLIITIFITLASFGLISTSFLAFVLFLVIGNIVNRVIFEFSLVILGIYENTTEMNKKLK